jgi:hypothetical protein
MRSRRVKLDFGIGCIPVNCVYPYDWFRASLCGPWQFFSFSISTQSVGLLGRGISPSQGHYLHTEQHKHRINAHRHPCIECDSNSTIPVFERAKTVYALDCAVTRLVTSLAILRPPRIFLSTTFLMVNFR